ncbi:MAG: methyltransferase domain-containing protein [Pseudomonadota bacterium]
MLSEQTVVDMFRTILGRAPESPKVVQYHQKVANPETLRQMLLQSAEFATLYARIEARSLMGASALAVLERSKEAGRPVHADQRPGSEPLLLARGIMPPLGTIETSAEGAAREALWDRVARAWAKLGDEAPHWSVLTHDSFRPDALEANRQAFDDSAEIEGVLIDAALERVPAARAADRRCVEIGCGVGRATRALAGRFQHVTGIDISAAHLTVAERELAAAGISNVTLTRAATVDDYGKIAAGHDFLFTRMVLQHNPPPVQAAILAQVFGALAPGAIALFQVVTYGRRYEYTLTKDKAGGAGMEMHVLPQSEVFRLLAESGLVPLEVQEDFAAGRHGPFRSHLFLAQKSGGAS